MEYNPKKILTFFTITIGVLVLFFAFNLNAAKADEAADREKAIKELLDKYKQTQCIPNNPEECETIVADYEKTLRAQPNYSTVGATPTTLKDVVKEAKPAEESVGTFVDCDSRLFGLISGDIFTCMFIGAGRTLLWISSKFVVLTAGFLNAAVSISLDFKSIISNMSGLDLAWKTIRDFVNIIFIFLLLYYAIRQILGMGDITKLLGTIVVVALFVNFSMFFTRLAIDASNIVSLQFYSSIVNMNGTQVNGSSDGILDSATKNLAAGNGIADRLLASLQLQSIYDFKADASNPNGKDLKPNIPNIIMVSLFGSVFMIITALIFLWAGFMFLARTAIFIFLLPLSPIWFIGMLPIKILKEYKDQWLTLLINQCLVAPIYLILLWVTFTVLTAADNSIVTVNGGLGGGNFASALATGEQGSMGIIVNFVIIITLMILSYKAAKKYSAGFGATVAGGLATAGGMMLGGVGGFVGRNAIGKVGKIAAGSERMKNWSEKSALGRMALKSADYTSKASFDVRNGIPGVSSVVNKVSGLPGLKGELPTIDMGKGAGVGGRKAYEEKAQKEKKAKEEAYVNSIKSERNEMLTLTGDTTRDTGILEENARRKAENDQMDIDEKARLEAYASRKATGDVLDRAVDTATLGSGRTAAASQVATQAKKDAEKIEKDKQKKEKLKNEKTHHETKRNGIVAALGASDEADAVVKLELAIQNTQAAADAHDATTKPAVGPARTAYEDTEKRLAKELTKAEGKLKNFQNHRKEVERIDAALK